MLSLFYFSCAEDAIFEGLEDDPIESIEARSYNQQDCGFIDAFCRKRKINTEYPNDPNPQNPSLTLGFQTVQNNKFGLVRLIDGSIGMVYETDTSVLLLVSDTSEIYDEKAYQVIIPNEIADVLTLGYSNLSDNTSISNQINAHANLSTSSNSDGTITVTTTNPGTTTARAYPSCDYFWTSDVESFVEVFFEEGDAFHVRGLVEDAFADAESNCPTNLSGSIPNMFGSSCVYSCVDPRCVVDYLLNLTIELNDYQKRVMVSRYLQEALGLTDAEQNWLTLGAQSSFVMDVYNQLGGDLNLGLCENEDCSMYGSQRNIIKLNKAGQSLSGSEVSDLISTYANVYCNNRNIYDYFLDNPTHDLDYIQNNKTILDGENAINSETWDSADGPFASHPIDQFDPDQSPWPSYGPVIAEEDAVVYNPQGYNCHASAKQLIAKVDYQISSYYLTYVGPNSPNNVVHYETIQIYTEDDGINLLELSNGLDYLYSALKRDIPVVVGIDIASGGINNSLTDNTTDHFVVVVGMGTDTNGNYFRFYDNASANIDKCTHPENKLYYANNVIEGYSNVNYASGFLFRITQIRKSKPI